ncbi:uncharacterized protein LAESUDRAFT_725861 [Laetiporus sulphureus 93-53]|uniref:Uncharacterized protein n=1 Tax=Laetiporus sulphureus 93-53 TaxID=1314785 RepID=A0A165E837_9APHY|nr:uncharacterized protein LAESUDRAFT_725861 [Laetiporus sulphureus 93-53]KZT06426.1 hypothetical protein LAESUDRAFT_725861 [Laetiporus sulphureus 93-53]
MMQQYLPCTLALRHRSAAAQPNGHSYVCHGSIYWRTLFCLRQARRGWTARTSIVGLATGARLCALKPRAASCALVARVAEGGGKSGLPPKGALATVECAQVTSAPSLISRRLLGATAQDVIKEWQVSLTSLRCTLALHGLGGVIYFHHSNGNKSKGDDPPRADPPRREENVREQVKSEDAYRFGECRCAGCEARREATRRAIEEYRDVIPRRFNEVYAPQLDPIWELYEEESRNRSQDDHLDMDYDLIVEDIPATPEKCYEPDREQNEVLLGLQRDRRNIVLDSTCPEVAPHIVISPPDLNEEWDLYWAVWINRMGPQDPKYLSLAHPDCRLLATLPPHADRHKGSSVETLVQEPRYGDDDATLDAEPQRVFSRSALQQRIVSASQETEVVYLDNVITAVRRHCYRASALAASAAASTFRARWDAADFAIQVEKPFMWIDPAETLLSFFFQCLGTLVIDSTTPYTTPHIVIQEPLPENLWGLYHNNTPSPQDCGLGNLLTVPSSFVDYVNLEPNSFEEDDYPADSRPSSSGMESNVPRTPEHPEDSVGVAVPAQCVDIMHADQISFSTSALWQTASQPEEPAPHGDDVPAYEEEEDQLPPFDEWYQSIARRAA